MVSTVKEESRRGHNLLVCCALCSSRNVRLKYAFAISYDDLGASQLVELDIS